MPTYLEEYSNDIRFVNQIRRKCYLAELTLEGKVDAEVGRAMRSALAEIEKALTTQKISNSEALMVRNILKTIHSHLDNVGL